jgi:TnpA family transposase
LRSAETADKNRKCVPVTQTAVSEDILVLKWKLVPDELEFIAKIASKKNLTWSAFSYLFTNNSNRFPSHIDSVPYAVRGFINRQFNFSFDAEIEIPDREATRTELRIKILERLGFESVDEKVAQNLHDWALEQAFKGLSWSKIRELIPTTLSQWKTLLPPKDSLQRLISKTLELAEDSFFKKISSTLTKKQKDVLNQLLENCVGAHSSTFYAIRSLPQKVNPESILEILDKFELIEEQKFESIDLKFISPKAVSKAAEFAFSCDVYEIKRFHFHKKLALLLCAIIDSGSKCLDRVVQMHEIFMQNLDRKSRNKSEKGFMHAKRRSKKSLRIILKTSKIVLKYKDNELLKSLSEHINLNELKSAIDNTELLQNLDERGYADELLKRHPHLKRYLPKLLSLKFSAEKSSETLLDAIKAFLEHQESKSEEYPCTHFEGIYRSPFREILGKLTSNEKKRAWEISLAFEIKDKLKTLNLFLPQSKSHKSFWTMIEGEGDWKTRKNAAYKKLAVSKSFSVFARQIEQNFATALERFSKDFKKNPFVYLDLNGSLAFHKIPKTKVPDGLQELTNGLNSLLPRHVPIEDVLFEVDALTQFSNKLTPTFPTRRKPEDEKRCILATILAHATNIGLSGMANATQDVTVDALLETTRSRLSHDALIEANDAIIDFHKKMSFSKFFETAPISSSDGQRFRVQENTLHADLCTRYFGNFRKAINFVTHITHGAAVFATQPLLCGMRESIAMVNGLCLAGDDFRSPMHTTDTHGYTDAMFLVLDLLGIQFAPRLKDLADAKLFLPSGTSANGTLAGIFEKKETDLDEFAPVWDEIVRVISALKSGQASAQSVLPKIISCQSGDSLALAFKKIGQVLKTTFLLRYFNEPILRQQIRHQLNLGETRHSLARQVFFSNKGEFRAGDLDSLVSKSSCLSMVCNAILLWNTKQFEKAFQTLEKQGKKPDSTMLKYISPLTWENIRISGRYDFKYNARQEGGQS